MRIHPTTDLPLANPRPPDPVMHAEYRQTSLFGQPQKPFAGRIVCWECAEELYPVRIGLWRCASCGRRGPIGLDGAFAALTFDVDHPRDIDAAHRIDIKWAIRNAIDVHEPLEVP